MKHSKKIMLGEEIKDLQQNKDTVKIFKINYIQYITENNSHKKIINQNINVNKLTKLNNNNTYLLSEPTSKKWYEIF